MITSAGQQATHRPDATGETAWIRQPSDVSHLVNSSTQALPEAMAALAMLALFLFGQGFGPGSHTMTYASLSYPVSLRGVGVGLNQTLMRASSTLSLFLFPLLTAMLDTGVFWVIVLAPLAGLIALLLVRWKPSGYDVDAEDFTDPVR